MDNTNKEIKQPEIDWNEWNKEATALVTDRDRDKWMLEAYNDQNVNKHVSNNISLNEEPTEGFIDNVISNLSLASYYNNDLSKGVIKGVIGAGISTVKFLADTYEANDMKEWMNNADGYLDEQLKTATGFGEAGDVIGRVGAGLAVTGGLSVATIPARIAQGFTIDLFAFEGDSGNIADVFKDHNISMGGVVEALAYDPNSDEFTNRMRNAISGGLLGGAFETTIAGFKYGATLIKNKGLLLEGDDATKINTVINAIKEESATLDNMKLSVDDIKTNPDLIIKQDEAVTDVIKTVEEGVQPIVKDTPIHTGTLNEGEKLYKEATERIKDIPDDFDEVVARGEQAVKQSDQVKNTSDLKQPLNANRIAPDNKELLSETTKDITADAVFISHKDLLLKANKELERDLGKEGFELVKDLTNTADKVDNLSVKITQARLVVGNLTQKYQEAISFAQKEGTPESLFRAIKALDSLVLTSKILKNATSSVAKALSAMRINIGEEAQLFNSLKIMDNLDNDYTMSLLRQAFDEKNEGEMFRLMELMTDSTKRLKPHLENYKEGWFKKAGNILSESGIASMLSSPTTLAVNVIGGTYMKHQRTLQDLLQYSLGVISRNPERMKSRELKYLIHGTMVRNIKEDLPQIGKNIKAWASSKFEDDVIDEAMLARYVQDQEHGRKYVSSYYIRGKEEGSADTTFNTMINTFGKLTRSTYKTIGIIDDYYKRSAFRSQLVRAGSRVADARKIADADYVKFIDEFVKVNTELHQIRNKGLKPTKDFMTKNKQFIGTGKGGLTHADEARDFANYMTMQSELDGILKKGVDFLNSDGFLRLMIPFKLTPINMLKIAGNTAFDPLKKSLWLDIKKGGVKRDIAIAKMAYSTSVITGLSFLATSGNITGSFSPEERLRMQSAGIPEYSFKIGDKWYDYRQLEPIATLAGVITDVYKFQHNLMLRKDDIAKKDLENVQDEVTKFMGDIMMSVVNNIVNKSYAKGMADSMSLLTGEGNITTYTGNLVSSLVPMSSMANFIGRVAGDGYKKESTDFSEKILSKYRVLLERDALDAYGRPIVDIEYTPFGTKRLDIEAHENRGAREVARLEVPLTKMSRVISQEVGVGTSIKVELTNEEYHEMRRSLDTVYHLTDRLNELVDTTSYKEAKPFVQARMLSETINIIKLGASQSIKIKPRVQGKIQEGATDLIKKVDEAPKATFNNMIFGGTNE